MIQRVLQTELVALCEDFPAVGIIGARQVGKTTLAKEVAAHMPGHAVYLDLERPSDVAKLQDPEVYFQAHRDDLIILDEVHRVPEIFTVLRSEIDTDRRPGRFLVLGSASPELLRQTSETLAGRIAYRELAGLNLAEVGPEALRRLWIRGGFPLSFAARSEESSNNWREAFVTTWLERDLPSFGIRVAASTLQRFWQMVAHLNGQLWNGNTISASLGVSPPTAARYLDLLQDLFVLRRLSPWHGNLKKRLVKTPKIYFRDTGLLHRLLNINSYDSLLGHPALGASWEAFCIEQIAQACPRGSELNFYRTAVGAEIDLLVTPPGARHPVAFEFKHSVAPALSRGFHTGCEDVKASQAYVVTPGQERFPLGKGITCIPAAEIPGLTWS